jgi:hypothetical protein
MVGPVGGKVGYHLPQGCHRRCYHDAALITSRFTAAVTMVCVSYSSTYYRTANIYSVPRYVELYGLPT